MAGAATPQILLEPIASGAGAGFITNPIPDAPTGTSAASVQGGFPSITMQEEIAGGKPPLGQDMNGYLFLISSHTVYVQCGQLYLFNSTLATDIGGYLAGTILGMADGTGIWMNTVNGNTSNPDTGGAGWLAIASSGIGVLSGLTSGTGTLSAALWKKTILNFSGALVGNVILIFPTIAGQQWLILNNCTGAPTLTCKTAAGSGVVIPAGGSASPTGIYCDGTNIRFSTSPLTIAIDQAPTPSTIAERDNLGNLLAVRFNGNSALENPAVGAVLVQNTAADGFFRKISPANFFNGLKAAIIAAISGTAGVVTSGSNSNGSWYKLPDGTIEQYGFISGGGVGFVTHTFPIAFPNACKSLTATSCGAGNQGTIDLSNPASSDTTFQLNNGASGGATSWRAVGN